MVDEKKIEELKAANNGTELHLLECDGHEFIVRRPTRGDWKRFTDMGMDDRKRADAAETLLRSVCLYPDMVSLKHILDERPGIVVSLFPELSTLAGAGLVVEKKTL